jgi:flagellar FliL protein
MAKAAKTKDNKEADETAEGGGEEAASGKPKSKFSLKMIVIAAGALLVLGGGGVAAFFVFKGHKEETHAAAETKPAVFLDLPDVLVNLSNVGSERSQYLKVKIVLELADKAMVAQVQPVVPRVLDAFQTYLRELRPTDLDGSAGLYRLKEEMTRRVNAAISPARVNAVLFKEIVVQ